VNDLDPERLARNRGRTRAGDDPGSEAGT